MNNIICDDLPDFVVIDGEKIKVNADYKNVLKALFVLTSDHLTYEDKATNFINFFYKEIPINGSKVEIVEKLINAFVDFLKGFTPEKENTTKKVKSKEILFDYYHDQELIMSDLIEYYPLVFSDNTFVHWFTFKMLLWNLPKESRFKTAIKFRLLTNQEIESLGKNKTAKQVTAEKIKSLKEEKKSYFIGYEEQKEEAPKNTEFEKLVNMATINNLKRYQGKKSQERL